MQTQRRAWKGFQRSNVGNFVVSSCIVAALVLHFTDVTPSAKVKEAHIQHVVSSPCVHPVSRESAQSGESSTLAAYMPPTTIRLDAALMEGKQRIRRSDADFNLLYTDRRCIPGKDVDMAYKMSIAANAPVISHAPGKSEVPARQAKPAIHLVPQKSSTRFKPLMFASQGSFDVTGSSMPLPASMLQGSTDNVFPYGQCTWWANQRYHQLYGIFVPWRTNADAFQWIARAVEFGWHISGKPTLGSIMVLQPDVDGAYGLGHVGVVEQILTDGRVIASSMNWGNRPNMVAETSYVLRPGVSFISATSV